MTVYHHRSDDLAATWTSAVTVATGQLPAEVELADGTLLLSYEDAGTCYLRSSDDRGATWSAAFGAQPGANPHLCGGVKGGVGEVLGRVFYNSSTGYVQYQVSYDRGGTWSTPVNVAALGSEVEPTVDFLADGVVVVEWGNYATSYENTNMDGSGSWT